MPRVLFICKQRHDNYGVSYGLINSCRFLCNALEHLGIESKTVSVIDNNFIDREVHSYKPTHVFIEALWVVPEKFHVLLPRYPGVKWYVRIHSNSPFLANEGIAVQWIKTYFKLGKQYKNIFFSANAEKFVWDIKNALNLESKYAPNVYLPPEYPEESYEGTDVVHASDVLNVGCFGAIRPMKNQFTQALAAMAYANKLGKILHFHINGNRSEQSGETALKNIQQLFSDTKHKLVQHKWCDHQNFIKLVKEMDIGMQVSFSETFNIVAADFVYNNIPLVGSDEIGWLSTWYRSRPTDCQDMTYYLWLAHHGKRVKLQTLNRLGLYLYNYKAMRAWVYLLSEA